MVQIVDHIGVRMPGRLALEVGMVRSQLRMLMGNDIDIDGRPDTPGD
jgi:hypothetical protein